VDRGRRLALPVDDARGGQKRKGENMGVTQNVRGDYEYATESFSADVEGRCHPLVATNAARMGLQENNTCVASRRTPH